MSDFASNICPICRSEFIKGENVKVCPECNIPHHQECWNENKGCSTFGCAQQNYMPTIKRISNICQKCGAILKDNQDFCYNCWMPKSSAIKNVCGKCGAEMQENQDFCPKCGTPAGGSEKNVCGKCGAELQENQDFCPKCGQKAGLVLETATISAISKFNVGVEQGKKKSKMFPIILAIVVVIVVIAGYFIFSQIQSANKEKAAKAYIDDAMKFSTIVLDAATNIENIADTVQQYWYDCIYNDKYLDDIDFAIISAINDKNDEIIQAITDFNSVKVMYDKIKKVPESVSDNDDLKDINDAVKELYNTYTDFYDFATDPTGNYTSFSDGNNSKTDQFLSDFRALNNLLD